MRNTSYERKFCHFCLHPVVWLVPWSPCTHWNPTETLTQWVGVGSWHLNVNTSAQMILLQVLAVGVGEDCAGILGDSQTLCTLHSSLG